MRLIIYVEPTSYLLPLWREISAQSQVDTRLVFLEENLTQAWNIDLNNDSRVEVLRGSRGKKIMRLWQLLKDPRTELVNLAGWGRPLLLAALLLAWLRGIPVCVESDTQFDPSTSWWRRTLKRLLLPLLFRIPRLFFPAGSRQADYFKRYGVPASRIRIIQMTVDVRAIETHVMRMRRGLGEQQPVGDRECVFLYVGRLEDYKGILDLLNAFAGLGQERCRLLIVGDGSLQARVIDATRKHPNIEFLGRLSGDELWRAYARAHVFVLPSLSESWGLVINEAMAAGLAIIATDRVGSVDDLVNEGGNGLVVPAGSPESLTKAMQNLARQTDLIAEMGQRSREIITNWTIEDEARILMASWDKMQ